MKYILLLLLACSCVTGRKSLEAVGRGRVCSEEVDNRGNHVTTTHYFIVRRNGYCEETSSKRYYLNIQLPEMFSGKCKEASAN